VLGDLTSQAQGENLIIRTAKYLENFVGTDDWKCNYIEGRCSFECPTKQERKTRSLWGIIWYH
jgi:hypothetical protein